MDQELLQRTIGDGERHESLTTTKTLWERKRVESSDKDNEPTLRTIRAFDEKPVDYQLRARKPSNPKTSNNNIDRNTTNQKRVNVELNNVHDWLTTNRLTLNTKKSNFLIFRPRQKKMHFSPQISILDCETNQRVSLEQKSYIKYLGVLIDQNLSWKNHVDSVIVKISKTIGMIAKLRYFVPSTVLVNILSTSFSYYLYFSQKNHSNNVFYSNE